MYPALQGWNDGCNRLAKLSLPVKAKRDARILKAKAIASIKRALATFNAFEEEGRITSVLLHLQHSGEMLLKASLVQAGTCKVFEPNGMSIGMKKCLNHAAQHLKSLDAEIGTFRAIDAMRDHEQHWYAHFDEALLFLEVRTFVTVFDDVLGRIFSEKLADHLPQRVLPVSTYPPPRDIATFFDSQFSQVKELLKPGKRRRHEARGRIRTLLAMEAHVSDDVSVTEQDVNRAEKGIRENKPWQALFPALPTLAASFTGEGATLVVRISKSEDLPAVRIVKEGDPGAEDATVVREIDVWNKFPFRYKQIAEILGFPSYVQASALARDLALKDDPIMYHEKKMGSQMIYGYSQFALDKMKQAIAGGVDIKEVYRRQNTATGKAHAPKAM
ncbi:MAG TPA: hypothetical protein VGC72_08545 [Candidatus Elarobacter sp.]|jgi:hypothetical protein